MAIPILSRGDACRTRTRPGFRAHLMRDFAKSRFATAPARFRRSRARGWVHGIAHQVTPEWWVVGCSGGKGVPEKNSHGPLPRFHPSAVAYVSREASCVPPWPAYGTRCRAW